MRFRIVGRALTLTCAAALAACGGTKPAPPPEPALVAVEVARGVPVPAPSAPRVAVLLDVSASMHGPAAGGVSRLAAAQTLVGDLVASLPSDTRFSVDAIGLEEPGSCAPSVRVVAASPAIVGGEAASVVRGLRPRGEGSLAGALQSVLGALGDEGSLDGARILVVSDLQDDCGGDLCAAVQALVTAGASLDLVVLGAEPTPDCVSAVARSGATPPGYAAPAEPPIFRVFPATGADVEGRAGGAPVKAAPGQARIQVELDPPLEVGPITLAAGALVRVRVLDFPSANPPVRDWSLEVLAAGGDFAASSPLPLEP